MAKIDFPASPSNNQTHTANNITWKYDSGKGVWRASTYADAPKGEKGQKGATGAKGSTGSTGAKGSTGSTGAKGSTGSTGSTGSKGQKGEEGTVGGSNINITNYAITSNRVSSWTGNPGTNGKIQYHSARWYIVSDSNSDRIVQFRQDGTDRSYIANNGNFVGTATAANWADLGEKYEADDLYKEGDLVAIGGDKEITLWQKGMPLAGVISVDPGVQLNYTEENKDDPFWPFVALKGRVPVKINGSAKKGDYIVADDNGRAKAVPHKINIDMMEYIGIALEDGEDVIEVKV